MALWSDIGNTQTIQPGATHLWRITYGDGLDVGVVVAAPNVRESQIGVDLVAVDQGVVTSQSTGLNEGAATHYTVNIRNAGSRQIDYNLDIADWQPAGAHAPTAVRVKQLPPGVVGGVLQPTVAIAAKKRAKRGGLRKPANRRR